MFNANKHRKTRKQLKLENTELRELVSKLEGQMKEQIELLLASNREVREYKQKINKTDSFRKESLIQLNYRLRTPLNELIGMSNLLGQSELNDVQKEYLGFISKAGNNLLLILNDVLFYMKTEYGTVNSEIKDINIRQLIEELLAEFKAKYADAEFYLKPIANIPDILKGDKDKLRIILYNILKASLLNSTDKIIVLEISVKDIGFDDIKLAFNINTAFRALTDEIKENLFMPFVLADSSNNEKEASSGLELAIANSLVKHSDGEISFEIDAVCNSIFTVSLSFKN